MNIVDRSLFSSFYCLMAESLKSSRSEFVIVCGRRRIGKTFLVDQFFNNEYDFTFVGVHKAKTVVQLRNFAKTKNRKSLVHTFVTTFGLGEGKHHSIVHSEVTMDDLFNS